MYIPGLTHLFLTIASVNRFNEKVFQDSKGCEATVEAIDVVIGDLNDHVKEKLLEKIPNDPTKTKGLYSILPIVEGEKYDITSNNNTVDGLTNGAECTVRKIEYKVEGSSGPSVIWVQFDTEDTGHNQRQQYKFLRLPTIEDSWTPILEIKKQFVTSRSCQYKYMRRQFPLRQAAAKTVHGCQGDTMKEAVVSFASRPRDHIHYVGLSRVVNLNGL